MRLIDYLPPKIKEIKEIADFQEAVEPELREAITILRGYLTHRNPLYSNREGIEKWEKWLRIVPDPNASLEERRKEVIARLNQRLPYTDPQLHKMLAGILDWGNFTITEERDFVYRFDINAHSRAHQTVYNLLERVMPAHVLWKLRDYIEPGVAQVTTGVCMYLGGTLTLLPEEKDSIESEPAGVRTGAAVHYGKILTIE